MRLSSQSFAHNEPIPAEFAFGIPDGTGRVRFGRNRNPHIAWSDLPEGTRSLVLTAIDSEVPTVFDHVNVDGAWIPANQPRQDFTHWLLANLDPALGEIAAGACSEGVATGGKRDPAGPAGSVQGVNDYGGFMQDGDYLGYDGPCPPWNDLRLHRYHFTLHALDVERLELAPGFTLAQLRGVMHGHVLGLATLTGSYAIHHALHGRP